MSRKPENTFIDGVHNHLPPKKLAHREKMNNPYSSGTADWWYSGKRGDIWIEYKYIPKIPKTATVLPDLTKLQQEWLNDRFAEGRSVFVIVGCPQGGVVYSKKQWMNEMTPDKFLSKVISRKDIARFIADNCGYPV